MIVGRVTVKLHWFCFPVELKNGQAKTIHCFGVKQIALHDKEAHSDVD